MLAKASGRCVLTTSGSQLQMKGCGEKDEVWELKSQV